jgi:Restriction alleviation protein Lar
MTDAMQVKEALLPCPFCGGKARVAEGCDEYWIACMSCQASSCLRNNIQASAAAWNTRAPSPAALDPVTVEVPMLSDIAQIIRKGWLNGYTHEETAQEVMSEFGRVSSTVQTCEHGNHLETCTICLMWRQVSLQHRGSND